LPPWCNTIWGLNIKGRVKEYVDSSLYGSKQGDCRRIAKLAY